MGRHNNKKKFQVKKTIQTPENTENGIAPKTVNTFDHVRFKIVDSPENVELPEDFELPENVETTKNVKPTENFESTNNPEKSAKTNNTILNYLNKKHQFNYSGWQAVSMLLTMITVLTIQLIMFLPENTENTSEVKLITVNEIQAQINKRYDSASIYSLEDFTYMYKCEKCSVSRLEALYNRVMFQVFGVQVESLVVYDL